MSITLLFIYNKIITLRHKNYILVLVIKAANYTLRGNYGDKATDEQGTGSST